MISIGLFYYCKNVFTQTNIWMIGKNSMKRHYLKKNIFTEDITDADYTHAEKACKDFEIKNLDELYDLYVESDILLLTGVFENLWNICLEIYEVNPAHFLTASGPACFLSLVSNLKKENQN